MAGTTSIHGWRDRLAHTFRSLRVRNYRLFTTGQLTKLLGVWMQFTAQDWLVLELSNDSASALGVVTALQFAPVLVFTLYGGKLADRYDKRRLLIIANAMFSVLALGLGVLVAVGAVTLGVVFVFAALMGVVNSVETPVRQSFVSELVERDLLPNALSLSAATFNTARVLGPAIAGPLIAVVSTGPVFLLNTLTYLAPMVGLLRMRADELHRDPVPSAGPATDAAAEDPAVREPTRIRDGLSYVRGRSDLVLLMALVFVIGLIGFNFQLTLSVMAKTVYGRGAGQFGLLTTALAVGALAGALASSGRRSRPSAYVVLASGVAFGVLEALVGLAPTFPATALLLVPTGFSMIFLMQASNQRIQMGTDAAYRGRVMALWVLVFLGTTPVGAPAVGWLSQQYGPRLGLIIGGLTSLAASLVALAWQLRHTKSRLRLRWRPRPAFYVIEPVVSVEPGRLVTDSVP